MDKNANIKNLDNKNLVKKFKNNIGNILSYQIS